MRYAAAHLVAVTSSIWIRGVIYCVLSCWLEVAKLKKKITDISMEERAALIAAAGRAAVESAKKKGIPVTGREGNQIVKLYPDGQRTVIKTLDQEQEEELTAN